MSIGITLLVGGRSTEHDASLHGYRHVLHELLGDSGRVTIVSVLYVSRAGLVHTFGRGPWPEEETALLSGPVTPLGAALERLRSDGSFVFSLLHGNEGEDGGWQGLAEVFGIRGSFGPTLASALGMNKYLQASLATALLPALRAPRTVLVRPESFDARQVLREIGPGPVVVKPNRMGASLLTTCLNKPSEESLTRAVEDVAPYDNQVLVQEFVKGREYSCGIYRESGKLVDLPIAEVVSQGFFGHDEKHTKGGASIVLCAEDRTTQAVREFSRSLFEATDTATFARFDYLVRSGEIYFLEVNTLPGLMSGSIFPMMLSAAGRTISDLMASAATEYDSLPFRNKAKAYDINH